MILRLLISVALAATAATPSVVIERVFGPETSTGHYKHPASIAQLRTGELFLAWYGGDGEYQPGTAVWGSRFNGQKWTQPVRLASDEFYSVGNPVIWQAPDGVLWLWYVIRPGSTWSSSRIAAKVSHDDGNTWSDSSIINFEEGTMVRGKPIVLSDGDYLLPVWKETGSDREVVGVDSAAFFLRFHLQSRSWLPSSRIHARLGALQPAVAEIRPSGLIAFCRRGGGYGPGTKGFIVKSSSDDGGLTWSQGLETNMPNPNAAVDLLKLANSHLLLIYNDSPSERTPLTVAISTDHGDTFPVRTDIATGPHDFAYPYAIQTRNGKIHLVFTSEGRTVINHATFEEADIAKPQGK